MVLEFLVLKDEYSEGPDDALITLDLSFGTGNDFVHDRQKTLRGGDEWYRVDLLFFTAVC